jgi:hypothetical protein
MSTGHPNIVDAADLDRIERFWEARMESEQDDAPEAHADSAEAELAGLAEERRALVMLAPPQPSRERLRIEEKLASEPGQLAQFDQYYAALAKAVAGIAESIAAGELDYVPDADPILILVAARASGVKI